VRGFLSRLLGLTLGVAVGVGMLWLSFRSTDWASVATALNEGDWTWPAVSVLAGTGLFVACKVARWRCLLGGAPALATSELLFPTTVGLALNALIPHSGELVRGLSLNRRHGWVTSAVLASIVAERVFDLFAVLLLAGVALYTVAVPASLVSAVRWVGGLAMLGSLMIVAVLVWPGPFRRLARGVSQLLPAAVAALVIRELDAAIDGFAPVRHVTTALQVLAWSLLQWLAIAGCAAACARVVGDPVSLGSSLLVVVGIVVAFLLPNAPGYAGSVQLAFVVSLGAAGVTPAHALAASVVYQCLMIAPVVILGLAWLRHSLTPTSVP
jgi:glycosyltransferase 2 family protein